MSPTRRVPRRQLGLLAATTIAVTLLAACGGGGSTATTSSAASDDGKTVFGFSQVGAESGWRSANTKSIQDSAKRAGIELKFSDAQGKQENQIKAIKSSHRPGRGRDHPRSGRRGRLGTRAPRSQRGEIPVILIDRGVKRVGDESLFATLIASDFVDQGRMAAEWLAKQRRAASATSSSFRARPAPPPPTTAKAGFAEGHQGVPRHEHHRVQTGDFRRAEGRKVMESIINAEGKKIEAVYGHNDDMAIGAIQAIESAGLKPGVDIKIVTIDAIKDGMTALSNGRINFIAECSPLLGPQLMELVKKIKAGEPVDARIVTTETTFNQEQAKAALPNRQY